MTPQDPRFVRNDSDKQQGNTFSLKAAFACAFRGLAYAFRTQRNMKIHAVFVILAIVLGVVLSIPLSSWPVLVLCIGLVIALECVNTSIESVVDLVSPEHERLAKYAKDCAAAGVLVAACVSLIVAAVIYGSALGEMIS